MFVLSRYPNEGVTAEFTAIDPKTGKAWEVKFQVVVVEIRGDKVRLGFEGAPDFIPIHRDEVWLKKAAQEQRKKGK
jgi:hypothetical protein